MPSLDHQAYLKHESAWRFVLCSSDSAQLRFSDVMCFVNQNTTTELQACCMLLSARQGNRDNTVSVSTPHFPSFGTGVTGSMPTGDGGMMPVSTSSWCQKATVTEVGGPFEEVDVMEDKKVVEPRGGTCSKYGQGKARKETSLDVDSKGPPVGTFNSSYWMCVCSGTLDRMAGYFLFCI